MFVIREFESGLHTVGHYDPEGKFHPESDHGDVTAAARRAHYLNGGALDDAPDKPRQPLGLAHPPSHWRPLRSVIGEIRGTGSGNVVLRIGRETTPGGGWQQTEYVVLLDAEVDDLVDGVNAARGGNVHRGRVAAAGEVVGAEATV